MNIRLLVIDGCVNAEPTHRLLRDCLEQERINAPIIRVLVSDEVEAPRYKFLGSPSIQIDGEDIDTSRQSDPFVLGCRIYQPGTSHPGVPPRQLIIDAIRRARGRT